LKDQADKYSEVLIMAENKWICPACGQENDGKFCVGCGAAAPVAEEVKKAEEVAAEVAAVKEEAHAPVEAAAEAPVAAAAAVAAEAAEAAPAAAEAAEAAAETISVPSEPAYDTTPVDQITEPIAPLVSEEEINPAPVDPDNFVPAEPDHSAPVEPASAGSYSSEPQPDYSDPDNFVPAPMHPEKQNSYSGGSSASSAEPKPAGYTQALVGLILAIAGIILLWVPGLGIGLAVAGLILSIVSKGKGFTGGMRTAGFVISLISIVLSVIGTVSCIACIACGYGCY